MNEILDTYNIVAGAVTAALTMIFGPFWFIFAGYLVFNVLDWLTGWYKARKRHEESSDKGLQGIVKKAGYWIIILVAFMTAYIFTSMGNELLHVDLSFLAMIGWFTLACLTVNEVRSIIENLVECGYDVPYVLIKGLAVADKLINRENEEEDENE